MAQNVITSSYFDGTSNSITEDAVINFVLTLNYENESFEFVKDDFLNAAHLVTPTTDLVLLNFIIKRQRDGLRLAFIDANKFQTVTVEEFETIYDSNIAKLMYPGYEEVYNHDFTDLSPYINDYIETQYIIDDIMTHFGRLAEYNLSAKNIYTIREITGFINHPKILKVESKLLSLNLFRYNTPLIFIIVFIIYWATTDIKTGFIASSLGVGAYWVIKSFKQFKKDIGY